MMKSCKYAKNVLTVQIMNLVILANIYFSSPTIQSYPWHVILMPFYRLRPGLLTHNLRVRRQHFIIKLLHKMEKGKI
jgi:hypothetical protein